MSLAANKLDVDYVSNAIILLKANSSEKNQIPKTISAV